MNATYRGIPCRITGRVSITAVGEASQTVTPGYELTFTRDDLTPEQLAQVTSYRGGPCARLIVAAGEVEVTQ